ncbi:hypothetical protein BD413DRAFT_189868 [Trametes elegans]|nr:hypothetical protein BD413DRAFT_189868 [Trametes elegans]
MSADLHRALAEDSLTIMFEHCTDRPHAHILSTSGPSLPRPASPYMPTEPRPGCSLDVPVAADDNWHLIPYDVPWGHEYYRYKAGTLPGPEGACIFLRSPTPLKNRRTQKACNKCRQRKAKCSGTRPTCTRCLARGYLCEYVEEDPRPARSSGRPRPQDSPRERESSDEPSDDADYSSPEADCPSPGGVQLVAPRPVKLEECGPSTPDLLYPDSASTSDSSSSAAEYCPTWDDSPYSPHAAYGYDSPPDSYVDSGVADYYDSPSYVVGSDMHAYPPQDVSPMYFHQELAPLPSAVHAPRPVRCTGSPAFLAPEELQPTGYPAACDAQMFQHDEMLIDFAAATADPAPQIALPQLPPMSSADGAAVHGGPVQ